MNLIEKSTYFFLSLLYYFMIHSGGHLDFIQNNEIKIIYILQTISFKSNCIQITLPWEEQLTLLNTYCECDIWREAPQFYHLMNPSDVSWM